MPEGEFGVEALRTFTDADLLSLWLAAVAESQPKPEVREDEFGKKNADLNRRILAEVRALREEVERLKSEREQ